jgi:hypothetical protein
MAKKKVPEETVNKSQAIRDFAEAHPKAGPKETAAALGEQGIDVSAAFVSTVKTQAKKKRKGRGRKKVVGRAKPAGHTFDASTLVQAKKLAEQMGGIEKAKAALAVLAKLQ